MSWPLGKAKQAEGNLKRVAAGSSRPLIVSGRWLAGAFGVVVVLAALCAYASLGLLFYQGQWQLILHPAKTITATPHEGYESIRFDYTEEGVARLSGWWIPADKDARWSGDTVLYLHGGNGSLSNYVGELDALHKLGVNVFAFDYRGYGASAGPHPDEARMSADAGAAWSYLTGTRHEAAQTIVIYGEDIGASLGAELAAGHSAAALVVDGPNAPARQVIGSDARAKILPMWLLLTQKFDPAEALNTLKMPKLFLDREGQKARTKELYQEAAQPKLYFGPEQGAGYTAVMRQFLWNVLTPGGGGSAGRLRQDIP
jgi:hypothetical protein